VIAVHVAGRRSKHPRGGHVTIEHENLRALGDAFPTRWVTRLPDGRLQCDLCPRHCHLRDGQRGLCFVRERRGDGIVLTTYGRSSGFCVDPIEKKPLHHFLPGSSVLSFGTAGCNLTCKFCQNWDISKSRETATLADEASPACIAETAEELGCRSVAFTYNDPVVFHEYAVDVARACRARGIRTVAVTAGWMCAEPRREFYAHMDAANVDLKGFTERFYERVCGARLADVLETLVYVKHETDTWLELTTLLVPGENDADEEIDAMTKWVVRELGAEVPVHFTAFHPDWRMRDVAPTPPATLARARRVAMSNGVRFAYTGNVHDREGGTTTCTCGAPLVVRDWYVLGRYGLTDDGRCRVCGAACPGVFDGPPGKQGRRRMPVLVRAPTS
jgi:pyruvate formate lyase activating enzyme